MRLLGGLLLALGIVIAAISGLCSAVMIVGSVTSGSGADLSLLPVVLIVGGIPFALGVALLLVGRLLLRRARDTASAERARPETFE